MPFSWSEVQDIVGQFSLLLHRLVLEACSLPGCLIFHPYICVGSGRI